MLIENYELEVFTPPCHPGSERYTVSAHFTHPITAVLPYLNATLAGANYMPEAAALIWKNGGHNVAFHADKIISSNVVDRQAAEKEIRELVDMINLTWERRDEISPDTSTRRRPTPMAIYKQLPSTNCRKCGEPTCYTFALQLAASKKTLAVCPTLFEPGYSASLAALQEMIIDAPEIIK